MLKSNFVTTVTRLRLVVQNYTRPKAHYTFICFYLDVLTSYNISNITYIYKLLLYYLLTHHFPVSSPLCKI